MNKYELKERVEKLIYNREKKDTIIEFLREEEKKAVIDFDIDAALYTMNKREELNHDL